jgi:hypothetical protein
MATNMQIAALAEKLSVEVDFNTSKDIALFAPIGFVMVDSGCHCVVVSGEGDPEISPARVRAGALAALRKGLEPCGDSSCSRCVGGEEAEG